MYHIYIYCTSLQSEIMIVMYIIYIYMKKCFLWLYCDCLLKQLQRFLVNSGNSHVHVAWGIIWTGNQRRLEILKAKITGTIIIIKYTYNIYIQYNIYNIYNIFNNIYIVYVYIYIHLVYICICRCTHLPVKIYVHRYANI
jgi:hypothetical protein